MTGISEPAFEKLIKLMMLSQSTNDNEALNAIRLANSILKAGDYNWEDFLRGKIVTFPDNTPPLSSRGSGAKYTDAAEINAYFDSLLSRVSASTSFGDFVRSVHHSWETLGFLTEKQYNAIKRSALR